MKIPITRPVFGPDELRAVQLPLESEWVVQGPFVQEFEERFAAYVGMAPVAVLGSLSQLGGSLPATFLVGCQPADVTDGMGLTPAVQASVDPAVDLVCNVLDEQLGFTDPTRAERQVSPALDREDSP